MNNNKNLENVIKSLSDLTISKPEQILENVIDEYLTGKINFQSITKRLNFTQFFKFGFDERIKELFEFKTKLRGIPYKDYIYDKKTNMNTIFKLDKHQIIAIKWIKKVENEIHDLSKEYVYGLKGGIIIMEMGLGKTLTSLSHMLSSPKKKYPNLVICSLTLINEWKTQGIEKFFISDSIKVLYLHKNFLKKEFIETLNEEKIKEFEIVITTYDVCINVYRKIINNFKNPKNKNNDGKIIDLTNNNELKDDIKYKFLYDIEWERITCDESQKFSNPKTITFKSMFYLKSKYKWCLSGTPIKNDSLDLWSQLRFCGYNGITLKSLWKKNSLEYIENHNIKRFLLIMNYEDANIKLPEKEILVEFVELNKNERLTYDSIHNQTKKTYKEMLEGEVNFTNVLSMFVKLRMCCIDKSLLFQSLKNKKKSLDLSK